MGDLTWGDTDGVHLIDRETGNATCDPRAGGDGTNKRGQTTCSMCKRALAERAEGDEAGYTISLSVRYREGQPVPKVGERVPWLRDDGRAMKPEVVSIVPPDQDGFMAATLYSRDRFYTDPETVTAGA